jgi:hypothetical protein
VYEPALIRIAAAIMHSAMDLQTRLGPGLRIWISGSGCC